MANKQTGRCSTSLVNREMQIKITVRRYFTLTGWLESKSQVTSVEEEVEKLEPSYTASGIKKWYSLFCKQAVSQMIKHSYMTEQFHSWI